MTGYQGTLYHATYDRTSADGRQAREAPPESPQRRWQISTTSHWEICRGIVLHAFEGKVPFDEPSLAKIAELRGIFDWA